MNNEEIQKLKIILVNFALYLNNDTGEENDNHEAEIAKFVFFIEELLEKRGYKKNKK